MNMDFKMWTTLLMRCVLLLCGSWAFAQTDIALHVDSPPAVVEATQITLTGSVDPNSATLTLNGDSVTVQPDGSFSHVASLNPTTNLLTVLAEADGYNTTAETVTVISDFTAPTIAITTPELVFYTNQNTVTVQGKLDDQEDRELLLYRDGSMIAAGELLFRDEAVSLDQTSDVTTTVFTYRVEDRVGHEASQTLTVHRKVSPPTVNLSAAPLAVLPGSDFDLDLTLAAADEITEVEIFVNGDQVYTGTDATAFSQTFTAPDDTKRIPVDVLVKDRFGNETVQQLTVTVLEPTYVFGTVRDDRNSHPVANATVSLTTHQGTQNAVTDDEGRFRFFTHGDATQLTIAQPGFAPVVRNNPTGQKTWRVADVRLTPTAPYSGATLSPTFAAIAFSNAATGLEVAEIQTQNLTSLLPEGYTPMGGVHLQNVGSTSVSITNTLATANAGFQLVWLKKTAANFRWQVAATAAFTRGATHMFSSLNDGAYVLAATRLQLPNVGTLLQNDSYAFLGTGYVPSAKVFPARVSLLDDPKTAISIVVENPQAAQASRTLAQVFYREVHDRYAGKVTLSDQTADIWLYDAFSKAELNGTIQVASRIAVDPDVTRRATIDFQAQPGPTNSEGLEMIESLKFGAITLNYANADDQTLAKSLNYSPESNIPEWLGSEVISVFTLQIAAIANQSPTLTFESTRDAIKLILLRKENTRDWIYAGSLSRIGSRWVAESNRIDMRATGTYALVALNQDITEINGSVTYQNSPVADAYLRHGNHPFVGRSGNLAFGTVGRYRFFVPQQPTPDAPFLERVPYLYTVTATDPATNRQGSEIVASTINTPRISDLDLVLDDSNFSLVSHQPFASQIGVALLPEIELEFDQVLSDDAAVRTNGVTLSSPGGSIPYEHYVGVNGRTMHITPRVTLSESTEYTVAVNANLRDRYGNAPTPTAFTFTTKTQAVIPDLVLSKFFVEPRGQDYYLIGPEGSFPDGTELQIVMGATASSYTQTINGPGYERLLTEYAEGDTIYLFATAPNGPTAKHTLDLVKTAENTFKLGTRPFAVEVAEDTTLHITGLSGAAGLEVEISVTTPSENQALTASMPLYANSGWDLAHAIRIEPTDGEGDADVRFEGRIEVAGLPALTEGQSYMVAHIQEGIMAPASPDDLDTMVAHNVATIVSEAKPTETTVNGKRFGAFGGFALGGIGAFGLFSGAPSYASTIVYSQIPAALYDVAKEELPSIYTATGQRWHEQALRAGYKPYGPAWAWGTHNNEGAQIWHFLGTTTRDCEIHATYPTNAFGSYSRIEGIDRWKGGRVVASYNILDFGYNDLEGELEIEDSVSVKWTVVVPEDPENTTDVVTTPVMDDFPYLEDEALTTEFRNFRRIVKQPNMALKAEVVSSGSANVFNKATLFSPAHIPEEISLNGANPTALYFPLTLLETGQDHTLRVEFDFANGSNQVFEASFSFLSGLDDDLDAVGPPTIVGVYPADGEIDVDTYPWLQFSFNESVKNIPGNIQLYDKVNGSYIDLNFLDATYQPIDDASKLAANFVGRPTDVLKLDRDYEIHIQGVTDRQDQAFKWLNPDTEELEDLFKSSFKTTEPEHFELEQAEGNVLWNANLGRRLNNLLITANRVGEGNEIALNVYDTVEEKPVRISGTKIFIGTFRPTQQYWIDFFLPEELDRNYAPDDFRAKNQRINETRLDKVPDGTFMVLSIDHQILGDKMYFFFYRNGFFNYLGESAHRNGPSMTDQAKMGPFLGCSFKSWNNFTFSQVYDIRDYYDLFLSLGGVAIQFDTGYEFTEPASRLQPNMILPVPGNPISLAPFSWRQIDEAGNEKLLYGMAMGSQEYPAIYAFDPTSGEAAPAPGSGFGITRSSKTAQPPIYDDRLIMKTDWSQLSAGHQSTLSYASSRQTVGVAEGLIVPVGDGQTRIADVAVFQHSHFTNRASDIHFYVVPTDRTTDLQAPDLVYQTPEEIISIDVDRGSGKMAVVRKHEEGFEMIVVDLTAILKEGLSQNGDPNLDILAERFVVFRQEGYYENVFFDGDTIIASNQDLTLEVFKLGREDYRQSGWLVADLKHWLQNNQTEDQEFEIRHHQHQVFYATDQVLPENAAASQDLDLYMELGTYDFEVKPNEVVHVTLRNLQSSETITFPSFTNKTAFNVLRPYTPYKVRDWIQSSAATLRQQGYLQFEFEIRTSFLGQPQYFQTVPFYYVYCMPKGRLQDPSRILDRYDVVSQTPYVGIDLYTLSSKDPRLNTSPRVLLHNDTQFSTGHYGMGSANARMLQMGMPSWWHVDDFNANAAADPDKVFQRLIFEQPEQFEVEVSLERNEDNVLEPIVRNGLASEFGRKTANLWTLTHRNSMEYRLNTRNELPDFVKIYKYLNDEEDLQVKDARFPIFRFIPDENQPGNMMAPAVLAAQIEEPYKNHTLFQTGGVPDNKPKVVLERTSDKGALGRATVRAYGAGSNRTAIVKSRLPNGDYLNYEYDENGYLTTVHGSHPEEINFEWEPISSTKPMGKFVLKRLKKVIFEDYVWEYRYTSDDSLRLRTVVVPHFGEKRLSVTPSTTIQGLAEEVTIDHAGLEFSTYPLTLNQGALLISGYQRNLLNNSITWQQITNEDQVDWFPVATSEPAQAFTYDNLGRLTSKQDGYGIWNWTYHSDVNMDRIATAQDPTGATTTYEVTRGAITVKPETGSPLQVNLSASGAPIGQAFEGVKSGATNTNFYTPHGQGYLTNSSGRVIEQPMEGMGVTAYQGKRYNPLGSPLSATWNGQRATITYDALNRPTEIRAASGEYQTIEYIGGNGGLDIRTTHYPSNNRVTESFNFAGELTARFKDTYGTDGSLSQSTEMLSYDKYSRLTMILGSDPYTGTRTRTMGYVGETSTVSGYGDFRRGSVIEIFNHTNGSTPAITSRTIVRDNKAETVNYKTDVLGRVLESEVQGSGEVAIDYDGWGRTTQVTSAGSGTGKVGEVLYARTFGNGQVTILDKLSGKNTTWNLNDSSGNSWSYTQEIDGFAHTRSGYLNNRVSGSSDDLGHNITQSAGFGNYKKEISSYTGGGISEVKSQFGGHNSGWESRSFDIYGNPLNLKDFATGRSVSIGTASNGTMTSARNLLNQSTTTASDPFGRTTQSQFANGQTLSTSYKDISAIDSVNVTDPSLGNTEIYKHADNWQSTNKHPLGKTSQMVSDIQGSTRSVQTTVTDPISNVNESDQLEIDRASGYPQKYTDFDGEIYDFAINNFGREVSIHNPTSGLRETATFDGLGNLKSKSTARISGSGKLISSRTTSIDYDVYGRAKTIVEGGNQTSFNFNNIGFLQSIDSSRGSVKFNKHEPTGTPTNIELPDSSTIEVNYWEDARSVQRISYNPVDGSPSYWEYDKFGNLVSMQEDGKDCISFTNNGWGMPTSVTTGGQTFNLIDSATPNLLTLPGGVEIEIDGSGNEYRRSFPGTADQIFDRDGSGRLRQVTTNGEMAIGIEYSGPLPSRHTMMQSINGPTETIDFTYLDDRISEKTSNLYGTHVFEYDADFPDQISAYSRDDFDYNYDFRNDGYLESLSFGPDGDLETFQYDYDDKGNQSAVAFRDFAASFEDYQNGLPSTITVQYAGTSSVIDIEQEGGYLTGYTATDSGQVPISFTLDSISQEKENNENCSQFESTVRIPTRAVKQTDRYLEAIITDMRSDQTLVGAQIVRAAGDLEAIPTSSSGGGSGSQAGKRSSSNQNLLSDVENHNVADVLSVDLDIDLDGNDDVTAQLLVRRHLHGRSNLLQTVTQQLATVPGDDQLLLQVIFENYGTTGNNLVRGQLDRDLLIFNLDKVGDEWHGTVDYYPMDVLQAQADSDAYQGRVEELTIARNETGNDTYSFGYDVFGNIDGVVDLRSGKETMVFDGSRHVYQIGDDGFTYDAFNRRVSSTDTGLSQNMVYAYHDSRPIAIGYESGTSVRWEYVIVHGPMGALFLYDMNDRDGVDRSYLVYTDHLGTPWAYRSMATGQVYHHSTAPWGDLNHNPVASQVNDGVAVPHAIQLSSGAVPVTNGHATTGGALKLFETPDFGGLHNFMGLSGHQRDPNGLIYMHNRYYDPMLGHFLTPDFRAPDIYDPSTFTEPYAYAAGNPLMYWDPDGLAVVSYDQDTLELIVTVEENDTEEIIFEALSDALGKNNYIFRLFDQKDSVLRRIIYHSLYKAKPGDKIDFKTIAGLNASAYENLSLGFFSGQPKESETVYRGALLGKLLELIEPEKRVYDSSGYKMIMGEARDRGVDIIEDAAMEYSIGLIETYFATKALSFVAPRVIKTVSNIDPETMKFWKRFQHPDRKRKVNPSRQNYDNYGEEFIDVGLGLPKKSAKGIYGLDFEKFLHEMLDGGPLKSIGGRDFDGYYFDSKGKEIWFEAKSGTAFNGMEAGSKRLAKFRSDMGDRLKIANSLGHEYVLFSNTFIPLHIKKWLRKKGIKFYELD